MTDRPMSIALLEGLRDSLPIDHPERPGIIRAIEILRSVIEDEER